MCGSPNIVRVVTSRTLKWAGHVGRMKEARSAFKILTGKPGGNIPRRRCEDNIRMDLKEIVINTRNWVDTTQGRNYWIAPVNAGFIKP